MQKVAPRVRARLAGEEFDLSADDLSKSLRGTDPEPIRDHFVVIDGRRYPPKQVIAVATGLDRADFTTHQARSILRRMGLGTGRLSQRGVSEPGPEAPWSQGEQAMADEIRPYRGRWVALRDGHVVAAADEPTEVVEWVRRHGVQADAMFRVPIDPAVDMGGFPG